MVIGKDQPEYAPMPAYISPDGQVIACFKLDPQEIQRVSQTGEIWLSVLTFNRGFEPVFLTTDPADLFLDPTPNQEGTTDERF